MGREGRTEQPPGMGGAGSNIRARGVGQCQPPWSQGLKPYHVALARDSVQAQQPERQATEVAEGTQGG